MGGQSAASLSAIKSSRLALPVVLLLVALIIPVYLNVGSIRLPVYRVVLLVMFAPLLLALLRGAAGRMRFPDYAVIGICVWRCISLAANHPVGMIIEPAGVVVIETLGAYLFGRIYIRTADDFRRMVAIFFRILLVLFPFAIIELLTTRSLMLEFFAVLGETHGVVPKEPRWGLDRVQGPFAHPILFGVFCGVIVSLVYKVLGFGRPFMARAGKAIIAGLTAVMALSSGPLTALVAQALLLSWEAVFSRIRNHWRVLTIGIIALTVLIELAANRSSPEIFISYFAFNSHTAWNRILIWEFGSQAVFDNPLFGLGLRDWPRPWFMSGSMDMFWLVPAVRGGVIPGLLYQAIMFWMLIKISARTGLSERTAAYRTGFAITLVAFYLVGWTVHFWDATFIQLMFLLGSGVWFLDAPDDEAEGSQEDPPGENRGTRARRTIYGARAKPYRMKRQG